MVLWSVDVYGIASRHQVGEELNLHFYSSTLVHCKLQN